MRSCSVLAAVPLVGNIATLVVASIGGTARAGPGWTQGAGQGGDEGLGQSPGMDKAAAMKWRRAAEDTQGLKVSRSSFRGDAAMGTEGLRTGMKEMELQGRHGDRAERTGSEKG